MKKRNFIIGLTLTLAIGIGVTAYAASNNTNKIGNGMGLGRITAKKGYEYVTSVLKDKLGLTDQEITNAKDSGKSINDIVKEKGMTQDQLKAALYDEKVKAIDEAVTKGTITKEQADTLKENIKKNMDNCTGNFGNMQREGKGTGNSRKMMGKGFGMMKNGQTDENCLNK